MRKEGLIDQVQAEDLLTKTKKRTIFKLKLNENDLVKLKRFKIGMLYSEVRLLF